MTPIEKTVNEENKTALIKYYDTLDDGTERYSYDYVIRAESMIYHVRYTCNKELESDYSKKFDKWIKKVSIESELINYIESGLRFSLPEYMKKINVNYADVCYSNDDNAEFFVYFYSNDGLLTELYLDMDSDEKEYWDWFCALNGYVNVEEEHDTEKRRLSAKYEYVEGSDELFLFDVILRNTDSLVHVTMCCQLEDRDIYEPTFDKWAEKLSLVYK